MTTPTISPITAPGLAASRQVTQQGNPAGSGERRFASLEWLHYSARAGEVLWRSMYPPLPDAPNPRFPGLRGVPPGRAQRWQRRVFERAFAFSPIAPPILPTFCEYAVRPLRPFEAAWLRVEVVEPGVEYKASNNHNFRAVVFRLPGGRFGYGAEYVGDTGVAYMCVQHFERTIQAAAGRAMTMARRAAEDDIAYWKLYVRAQKARGLFNSTGNMLDTVRIGLMRILRNLRHQRLMRTCGCANKEHELLCQHGERMVITVVLKERARLMRNRRELFDDNHTNIGWGE